MLGEIMREGLCEKVAYDRVCYDRVCVMRGCVS